MTGSRVGLAFTQYSELAPPSSTYRHMLHVDSDADNMQDTDAMHPAWDRLMRKASCTDACFSTVGHVIFQA